MRLRPHLDYKQYRQLEGDAIFRFTGNIESITDGHTLWVRGEDLSIPVSLLKTKCYLLPKHEGEGLHEAPEQIRWNRVSTLTEGSKVFIGGKLKIEENRFTFLQSKENPLMVIFYNCPDAEFPAALIRAARTRNEYWNSFTPASIGIGALILIYIAASFLDRPAFRLTVISALTACFIPVLPILPPGLFFTSFYRRLSWNARKLRAEHDLARFALLPGSTEKLANYFAVRAYSLEVLAWVLMILGVAINLLFIFLILFLFGVISF